MLFSPDQNTTSENIINMVADFYKSSTLEYLFDWVQGETSDYPNLSLQPLGFLNWFSRHGVDVNCALYRHNAMPNGCRMFKIFRRHLGVRIGDLRT